MSLSFKTRLITSFFCHYSDNNILQNIMDKELELLLQHCWGKRAFLLVWSWILCSQFPSTISSDLCDLHMHVPANECQIFYRPILGLANCTFSKVVLSQLENSLLMVSNPLFLVLKLWPESAASFCLSLGIICLVVYWFLWSSLVILRLCLVSFGFAWFCLILVFPICLVFSDDARCCILIIILVPRDTVNWIDHLYTREPERIGVAILLNLKRNFRKLGWFHCCRMTKYGMDLCDPQHQWKKLLCYFLLFFFLLFRFGKIVFVLQVACHKGISFKLVAMDID